MLGITLLFTLTCAASFAGAASGPLPAAAPAAAANCGQGLLPERAEPFHTMNVEPYLRALSAERRLKLRKVEAPEWRLSFYCEAGGACFSEEGRSGRRRKPLLQLRDPLGRRFEVRATASRRDPELFRINPRDLEPSPPPELDRDEARARLRNIYVTHGFWAMGNTELANQLFYPQLARSESVLSAPENRAQVDGIRAATELTVAFVRRRAPLTTRDLMDWHRALSLGVFEGGSADLRAGRYRKAEAFLSYGDIPLVAFAPATGVPAATASLLRRVAELGPDSDPVRAFALYQEFLRIHPFADLNGRLAARQLLNYMLLRMELPPEARVTPSLFHAPSELFARYFTKWRKNAN